MRAQFGSSEAFFAQPAAAKHAVAVDPAGAARGLARGYIGVGGESGSAEVRPYPSIPPQLASERRV